MSRINLNKRTFFLSAALIYITLLSFRPIPSIYDRNDTGRYIRHFNYMCSHQLLPDVNLLVRSPRTISWLSFDTLMKPICLTGEERLFLFVVALAIPMTLFCFGQWENVSLWWPFSIIFSVATFELATNAMRQGVGLFFLMWGIYLVYKKKNSLSFLVILVSAFLHNSNVVYLPIIISLYLWLGGVRLKRIIGTFCVTTFIVMIVGYAMFDSLSTASSYWEFRRISYEKELTPLFVLFMWLPVFYTYFVRKMFTVAGVSTSETAHFVYSCMLLVMVTSFFPNISYRFAITSTILQMFLAVKESDSTAKQGMFLLVCNVSMLVAYLGFSKAARGIFFG